MYEKIIYIAASSLITLSFVYGYFKYKEYLKFMETIEYVIKRFLYDNKLVPRKRIMVELLDNDKYLCDRGYDMVPIEYLRMVFQSVKGINVDIVVFKEEICKYLQYVTFDEHGAVLVNKNMPVLTPPEPPKDYPPMPPGWEDCNII